MRFFFSLLLVLLLVVACSPAAFAQEPEKIADDYNMQEFPARPTPSWVNMIDQGQKDERLKGIFTPAGIKVEIVADAPTVIDPVDITFDDQGNLFVLEWRQADDAHHSRYEVKFQDGSTGIVNRMTKSKPDELKQIFDTDGDGVYNKAVTLMNDLEIPSSLLIKDGWFYLPSVGHVIRRKRSKPDGPFDVQEEILRGLCGFHHHQASGLTVSPDGWMYVTSGDDDNRAEGSDGTRATVLRTGAVFRCRPDGSHVSEFARGFRNPYRNVAFDENYNIFHVDNDQEDGSKFTGVRLMHVLEGSDFGWRLYPGAVCCVTDFARGAVWGEKPGKVPSMLKTGRGSPAGLLIYNGTAFPEAIRGLLIYPDVFRKTVRAYRVKPRGSSFEIVEQLELMKSDNGLFRPCETIVGPDGAIYVCDWATDSGGAGRLWGDSEHGRIYRLTWTGIDGMPAISPGSMQAWAEISEKSDDELAKILDGKDFELRDRALDELARRVAAGKSKFSFLDFAKGDSHSVGGRGAAMGGACRAYDETVQTDLAELLKDKDADIRRLACEAIARNTNDQLVSSDSVDLFDNLAEISINDPSLAARRAAAISLGHLAGLLDPELQLGDLAAASLVEAYLKAPADDLQLRDGIIRGLESAGHYGLKQIEMLILLSNGDGVELGVSLIEAMRTEQAGRLLDKILTENPAHLTAGQWGRLLNTYRHILVEPAIPTVAITNWLAAHPDADPLVQIEGLQSLGLSRQLGSDTGDAEAIGKVAAKLLQNKDEEVRIAAISAIGDAQIAPLSKQLAAVLSDSSRSVAERAAVVRALGQLRSRTLPFSGEKTTPGVETVLDDLEKVIADEKQGSIRGDALTLLATVDFGRAAPVAQKLLESEDGAMVAAAINALGANRDQAQQIGQRFVDGKFSRNLLPQVAEAVRRHALADKSGELTALLNKIYAGGLVFDAKDEKLSELLKTGVAARGRTVFFDEQRTQCAKCHQLEGTGGKIGPDLTRVWETQTTTKVIESMLDPSKEIKEGFANWIIETTGGQVYNGLKISDTPEEVVLRDANGEDIRIPADEIDTKEASKTSLMPDGVVSQLSLQEFVDLIAFLKSEEEQKKLRK